MKTDELKAWGLTEEQSEKVMAQYGKDISKLQKENEKLTADRDKEKERADTAEETLRKFDGVDLEGMKAEVDNWKAKAENAEKDYADKIAQRDFEDALKEEISGYKFTSEAAKKAIMAEIREAGLKVKDGKILGLSDLLAQMKEKDASAFVDEKQEQLEAGRAKPFTGPLNQNTGGQKMTKSDILNIKDAGQRQSAIAQNLGLFGKGE